MSENQALLAEFIQMMPPPAAVSVDFPNFHTHKNTDDSLGQKIAGVKDICLQFTVHHTWRI